MTCVGLHKHFVITVFSDLSMVADPDRGNWPSWVTYLLKSSPVEMLELGVIGKTIGFLYWLNQLLGDVNVKASYARQEN